MTDRTIRPERNTDKRISVHESTRERLRECKGSSYSETIKRLVPEDAEVITDETGSVSVSVDQETYDRVMSLSGSGVPARAVIEYYLLRELVDAGVSPYDVLDEVYGKEEVL